MTKGRSLAVAGLCLLLIAAICTALPARPANGNGVSGVYAVQQSSSAGTDTQVTLNVGLTSSSDATLTSKSVALRSVLSGTTQPIDATFSLPPNGTADFKATVTITQAEFKLWQQGARPQLVLQLQSSDGGEFTQTVALVPFVHAEGN